jgi:hypothetical protein
MPADSLGARVEQEPIQSKKSDLDRTRSITEILESSPERVDPEVRQLMELFVREYPQAVEIGLELFHPTDAFDAGGFYEIREEADHMVPVIFISEGGHERLQSLIPIRKTSIDINAHLLGIKPEQMTTRLLHRFILAHELGHAMDFIRNYRQEHEDDREAKEEMSYHRELGKATLPVPGISPTHLARELSTLHTRTEVVERFPALAQHPLFSTLATVEDILRLQEQEYRATPQERYADEFAKQFLTLHAVELGFPELIHDDQATVQVAA